MIIKPKYYVLCVVLIVALLVSWFVIGAEKDKIIAVSIEGGILAIIIARMVQIKLKKVNVGKPIIGIDGNEIGTAHFIGLRINKR